MNPEPYGLDACNGVQGTAAPSLDLLRGYLAKRAGAATNEGYRFTNGVTGLCMDVLGGGSANGTKAQSSACNGNLGQIWAVN